MRRLLFVALLLGGCGRSSLSTRDAAPYVDDDPYLKLDAGAAPTARTSDAGRGGSIAAPDGPVASVDLQRASAAGAEAALRDIAKLLWEAEPDPAHLALARSGQIQTSADLEKIVREMLANPHSATGVGKFYRWWLNLEELRNTDKDPMLFPLFPKVVQPLIEDVVAFGVNATLSDGRYSALMTGRRPYGDMSIAALVGDGGDDPRRAGILARPGVLALHARPDRGSPVLRGYFIYNSVLCGEIPPHPAGVQMLPPPPSNQTNREQYEALTAPAACTPCHKVIDPIGYGLESFDAVGAMRLVDHGRMINDSGVLRSDDGIALTFKGATELGKMLTGDGAAQQCIVRKWYHYLRGMPAPTRDPLLDRAQKAFAASSGDMREVIVVVLGAHPL